MDRITRIILIVYALYCIVLVYYLLHIIDTYQYYVYTHTKVTDHITTVA